MRIALVLLALASSLARAQSTLPMCYDSTRAAYFPRPTRAGDTLITAPRSATTVCLKPATIRVLVRAGAADTVTVAPGSKLVVPIITEAGLAAIQMTLGYATTRVTLDSLAGAGAWTATLNPTTRAWNAFSARNSSTVTTIARAYFTVKSPTGRTNVSLLTPYTAADELGRSIASRLIVRNLVVCVAAC